MRVPRGGSGVSVEVNFGVKTVDGLRSGKKGYSPQRQFRCSDDLWREFQKSCKRRKLVPSKRLRFLMAQDAGLVLVEGGGE